MFIVFCMSHLNTAIKCFDSQIVMAARLKELSGKKSFHWQNITNWKSRGVPPFWWHFVEKASNEERGEAIISADILRREYFEIQNNQTTTTATSTLPSDSGECTEDDNAGCSLPKGQPNNDTLDADPIYKNKPRGDDESLTPSSSASTRASAAGVHA